MKDALGNLAAWNLSWGHHLSKNWVGKTLAQGDDDWNQKGDDDWKQQHWKAHDNRSTDALRAWVFSERGLGVAAWKEAPNKATFLKKEMFIFQVETPQVR